MNKEKNIFNEVKITKIWNQDTGNYGNFNLSKDQKLIKVNFLFDAILKEEQLDNLNGYIWIQRDENYFKIATEILYDGSVLENIEYYKKKTKKGYEHYKLDLKTSDDWVYEETDVKSVLDNIGLYKNEKSLRISTFKK